MWISDVIKGFECIRNDYGEIKVFLQEKDTTPHEVFFVVPEEYTEDGKRVIHTNIRSWPY